METIEPINIVEIGFTFKSVKDSSGRVVHNGTERLGDRLIFSSIPQMIFEQRGYKVADLDNCWQWDNCPYVVRGVAAKQTIPLQMIADRSTFHRNLRNMPMFMSVVDKYCAYLGLECTIRHPKLYKFEDSVRNPKKIIITTQGNNQGFMMNETAPRILPDFVISQILNNYKGFEIVQIGSKSDKRAEGTIDKRGLSVWESVKEVSEAMIYIGVNTGVFHIASAFPHISKKIVLCEYNDNALKYYLPLNPDNHHSTFLYMAEQFYNVYDRDVGITTSYRDI